MKVMMLNTLDGLRGRGRRRHLGRLPLEQHNTVLADYNSAVNGPLQSAMQRMREAARASAVPIAEFDHIENRYNDLTTRVMAHGERLSAVNTESELAAWLTKTEKLAAEVDFFVNEVGGIIGYEAKYRPLKVGLLALGTTAVLGGIAYAVYAYQPKRRRGRRRRRR